MWWLITLLVLALVAFFAVKFLKSNALSKQQEHSRSPQNRVDASAEAPTLQSTEAQSDDSSTTSARNAGAAAMAATAAAVTTAKMAEQSAAGSTKSGLSAATSTSVPKSLQTGNTASDVREMIKILNLDGPDARRLDITGEELSALRKGATAGIPDNAKLEEVAVRLRKMLA